MGLSASSASSLRGWPFPRPQARPANPARLPGASLSPQDEATNTQRVHRAGVSAFTLSIGFKAPILLCCQNTSLSFFFHWGWPLCVGWHPPLTQAIHVGTGTDEGDPALPVVLSELKHLILKALLKPIKIHFVF